MPFTGFFTESTVHLTLILISRAREPLSHTAFAVYCYLYLQKRRERPKNILYISSLASFRVVFPSVSFSTLHGFPLCMVFPLHVFPFSMGFLSPWVSHLHQSVIKIIENT